MAAARKKFVCFSRLWRNTHFRALKIFNHPFTVLCLSLITARSLCWSPPGRWTQTSPLYSTPHPPPPFLLHPVGSSELTRRSWGRSISHKEMDRSSIQFLLFWLKLRSRTIHLRAETCGSTTLDQRGWAPTLESLCHQRRHDSGQRSPFFDPPTQSNKKRMCF